MIRIMRTNLLTGKTTKYAGYDCISIMVAEGFLEMAAQKEAKTFGGHVRSKNHQVGEKIIYQRIVSDEAKQDVVSFQLKCT